ncbi:MAG: undecaprenyl-phosphate glucose phosphotransferase [Anaerolineae bacterium]
MKRKINILFTTSLVAIDMLMIALAFYLAYQMRLKIEYPPPRSIAPFSSYLGMMSIQVATMLLLFFMYRLYHRKRGTSHIDEFYSVFGGTSVGTVMATAVSSFAFKNELDYPRLMIVYAWLLTIILVTVGRIIHARLRWALQARGFGEANVLVVGAGEVGRTIVAAIRRSPGLGYRVVGVVDDNDVRPEEIGAPILGTTSDLSTLIVTHGVDEVIIALPEASHQELLPIISRCRREGTSIKVFPDVFQIMASEVSIGDLNGLPMLSVRDVALRGWRLTLKRVVDLLVSAAVLVTLSPLMLLVALLIKLDSKGPVFYIQERMGLDGKPFQILKFRSMRLDAEDGGPGWTVKDDPRRTQLGAFIRRFSIDELPQFINVLLGEMSVVGPRPERPVFVRQFRRMIPRYMERHQEKAGITGWAQVNGLRGDTSIAERTKYDVYYIENWSLLFDFKIMLRTIFILLTQRSVY